MKKFFMKGRSELPQPSTMCKRSVPVVLGSEDSYYTDYEVIQGVPRDPANASRTSSLYYIMQSHY